ncbi:MAG: hypothetical protein DRO18_00885 [Thermoprotei archaeon]|nr:MAG: hypothetical protein DRO18_00885 [Thermoprotei archaeon]
MALELVLEFSPEEEEYLRLAYEHEVATMGETGTFEDYLKRRLVTVCKAVVQQRLDQVLHDRLLWEGPKWVLDRLTSDE